ncbi:hypothetical protein Hanom_Chr08g00747741 [Helianthus anomalus]
MQWDDILNDSSACREILGGLGTPFETARARGLPRQNRIYQLSSMLVGSSIIANAIMEDYNVLARREEETIRLRAEVEAMVKAAREGAELNNLKAANAALVKEKAAIEAASKEAEARGAKALEEADADRAKLNKAVEELKVEVQNRVTIIAEVSARATEAEVRAREAEETRDDLATSLSQVTVDHLWMREHDIGHIVGTILDAPENSRFTDERSGFHGVDTEAAYAAAVDAYNNLSILTLDDIEKCLEVEDYMDRSRLLFDLPEEDEDAGVAKNDAGTSGTKAD